MATQVKFYSTAKYSSTQNAGGIYFVGGPKNGELYRGTTRFGAGRVTEVANTEAMNAITDAIRGDIAVCAIGGAFAYDGTKWVAIGPDLAAVRESWLADISASLQALDVDFVGASDTTSIITGIKQVNGKIVAHAEAFPELTSPSDGHLSLNGTDVEISGWSDLVDAKDDLESRVRAIESIVDYDNSTVTAETGIFKNLTVSDTATFNATVVSATTLAVDTEAGATFGGKTISAIADREAAAKIAAIAEVTKEATGANVVTVSVTTKAGSVDKVEVGVQKATAIGADGDASDDKLATEKAVRDALNSLDNAMHFTGVVSALPTEGMEAGDIVVVGTPAADSGLVAGQEYIYDGSKWELIGDQNTYAMNAYSKADSEVMTGVTTVPTALDALADAVDGLNAEIDDLDADEVAEAQDGLRVRVVQADGLVTTVEAELVWLDKDGAAIGDYSVKAATPAP